MLLDSNAIIYFSKGNLFSKFSIKYPVNFFASKISVVEVLGYHKLEPRDKIKLEEIFDFIELLNVDDKTIELAVNLRQKKKMSLGDSIIAATTLLHKLPLVTANEDDFKWLKELQIINPLK